ncbi:hypothetical protein HPB50_014245 [Hyalomma asiaticum]|uniref:Uncharacterized protein n=1 Tax=Hyalomma asiaticum TaxID=266040 RepID=A0ACB7RZZ7_HYAAI|nr:hypothetical protein HPB50_014245 [Hyalomma asiaticum]
MFKVSALKIKKASQTANRHYKNSNEKDGRYEVRLPWKKTIRLEDNFSVATKHLGNLMRKLMKDHSLLEKYDKTIRVYLDEGSAERDSSSSYTPDHRPYYKPHRAVIKEDRTTTMIRIIFDASSHERGTKSLNNNLESEDRDSLRFFWFANSPEANQPLPEQEIWRMARVRFGETSCPFLLMATLQRHFRCAENCYKTTALLLQKSMYMADLLIAADKTQDAIRMHEEVVRIFKAAYEHQEMEKQ